MLLALLGPFAVPFAIGIFIFLMVSSFMFAGTAIVVTSLIYRMFGAKAPQRPKGTLFEFSMSSVMDDPEATKKRKENLQKEEKNKKDKNDDVIDVEIIS